MPNDEPTTQKELALSLQRKLLKRWDDLLDNNEMSPTDARTLAQFLRDNGWEIRLDELPDGIRGKLTEDIDPEEIPNFRIA